MSALPTQFPGKILITGVGRSGTTFLIRLFTLLKMDTGFTSQNMQKNIFTNCNSGMECNIKSKQKIIKDPRFCDQIESFVNAGINISCIIVPIRKLSEVAASRAKLGPNSAGGFWGGAKNYQSQLNHDHKLLATLIQDATLKQIPIILLSFHQMVSNPRYLYDKIEPMLTVSYDEYLKQYQVASNLSKPK